MEAQPEAFYPHYHKMVSFELEISKTIAEF